MFTRYCTEILETYVRVHPNKILGVNFNICSRRARIDDVQISTKCGNYNLSLTKARAQEVCMCGFS